ncbi:TIGR04222 domain-containing membrane protein [Isoptericola sp. BMS4]|uniref:TIGR04222 domain-containing membrane protein n=1 Tax=Isoptericola sp. BMS4 TaxID=2527875 RepID=UPI001422F880|nr:TIGR04222 domain-containing membrane protein [Isoptericola sp. BMS4]
MDIVMASVGVLVGAVPGVLVVRSVRNRRTVEDRRLGEGAVPPDAAPEPLTDDELAYLSGGPERVAQVALAGLFLDGRVEGSDRRLRPVPAAEAPAAAPGDATLRRTMARRLATQGAMGVRDLAVTALAMDGGVEQVAKGLQERGLCRPASDLHQARERWAPVRRRWYVVGGVSAGVTVVGGILLAVLAPDPLAAFLTGALAAWTAGCLRAGIEASDTSAAATPRTTAGDAAVGAAADSMKEFRNTMGRGLDRDGERRIVLRSVAARGFGGLEGGPYDDQHFLDGAQPPSVRLPARDLRYGLYRQGLEPFVTWCLFRNHHERKEAASRHEPFDRAPTQELWDQQGASTQPVVDKGSRGNWRLERLYRFRDTTVNEGW